MIWRIFSRPSDQYIFIRCLAAGCYQTSLSEFSPLCPWLLQLYDAVIYTVFAHWGYLTLTVLIYAALSLVTCPPTSPSSANSWREKKVRLLLFISVSRHRRALWKLMPVCERSGQSPLVPQRSMGGGGEMGFPCRDIKWSNKLHGSYDPRKLYVVSQG